MTVISAPQELLEADVYIDLNATVGRALYLKCEGFNFGGSLKMRTAAGMMAAAERDGRIRPDTVLVESSSGNIGIALSVIAANKKIPFVCVTDVRCNPQTVRLMQALGAKVEMIEEPHPERGFLGARREYVRRLCHEDARYLSLNQYDNEANWMAHYTTTAVEIDKQFPDLNVLFVGVGTGGTIMGCVRYFAENCRDIRVVGIDTVGSVTFGLPPAPRLIPGLGASVPPPFVDQTLIDDVVHVTEAETIRGCRTLSARGFLLGGSSGTGLSGALSWLERNDPERRLTAVAIAPDLGERYVDTIYNDAWVREHFGDKALPIRI